MKTWLSACSLAVSFAASASPGKFQLNDWFALGSGCRAKFDEPGNVTTERSPDGLTATFQIKDFLLRGMKDKPKAFAKECAIRVHINPKPSERLVGLIATTEWSVSKGKKAELAILGALKLGSEELGRHLQNYPKGRQVKEELNRVVLKANVQKDANFPNLGCGEAKIIGFDYTWIARDADDAKTVVELKEGLKLVAETQPCQS